MANRNYKYQSRVVANWDRIPVVEGRVLSRGSVKIDGKDREYLMVETTEGEVQVFTSAGLADLFAAVKVGFHVRVEFLALVQTKKDRTFRQFRASCWTEEGDAPMLVKTARAPRTVKRAAVKA